jgi:formate hydrogenlyase transcriptional activator
MHPVRARTPQASWLVENGPRELELLFHVIVYHRATPILVADNDGHCRQASAGASKLLGLPREKIIGRKMDDFAEPSFRPRIPDLWRAFLETGEQEGKVRLTRPDGSLREVTYTAKESVLPVRHVMFLHEKASASATQPAGDTGEDQVPASVEDYALFLMDVDGWILTWYAGAEHIYGYKAEEVIGRNLSFLYPIEDNSKTIMQEVLNRSATSGYFASEGWRKKKDGSNFWAGNIMMALKDEKGELRGFGAAVRL